VSEQGCCRRFNTRYHRIVKRWVAAILVLTAIGVVIARRHDFQAAAGVAKTRLAAKATVEERLRSHEAQVIQRLTPALKSKGLSYPLTNFTLLVIKDTSRLELRTQDGGKIKEYAVLAESGRLGPKLREGDKQIPEGIYKVTYLNPNSLYHLSLRLNYPNEFDQKMAKADGRTQLGGDIMIHGKDVSIGCVAIGDPGIEELFCLAARAGMQNIQVVIVPTDWRTKPFKPGKIPGPSWLPELYAVLKEEVERLK
jgi:murein L,D-transpeptidase YafK